MSDYPPVVPAEECFDPATTARAVSNGRGRLRVSAVDDYMVGDEVRGQVHELPTERRVVPAGTAILDDDAQQTALWGHNSSPLWAPGESLFIVGPIGVGKTTLGQRLVLARLGVSEPELLGLPVVVDHRPWLYIAADRPRQALRSMRRMVSEEQREILDDRLLIWKGPLPFTLTKEPWRLATWLQELGCAGVFVDSLKDIAVGLSSDEVGGQVNLALQEVTAAGMELVVNHHQRKGTTENRRPKALEDVYGSTWLVAGAGSVVILWGAAGDPILELHHLKQPAEPVGPFTVGIDHAQGAVEVYEGEPDLLQAVNGARRGMSATGAAMVLFRTAEPDRNQVERARRRLSRLQGEGLIHRRGGGKDDTGRQVEALYFGVASVPEGLQP